MRLENCYNIFASQYLYIYNFDDYWLYVLIYILYFLDIFTFADCISITLLEIPLDRRSCTWSAASFPFSVASQLCIRWPSCGPRMHCTHRRQPGPLAQSQQLTAPQNEMYFVVFFMWQIRYQEEKQGSVALVSILGYFHMSAVCLPLLFLQIRPASSILCHSTHFSHSLLVLPPLSRRFRKTQPESANPSSPELLDFQTLEVHVSNL